MNHSKTVREISKRLPRLKRRDITEVLEVMTELWCKTLSQPGQTVPVSDLGKLIVEVQDIRVGGAIRQQLHHRHGVAAPKTLKRVYVRFRPSARFREAIQAAYREEGQAE
jgi:nucleoid DNA-binding protein